MQSYRSLFAVTLFAFFVCIAVFALDRPAPSFSDFVITKILPLKKIYTRYSYRITVREADFVKVPNVYGHLFMPQFLKCPKLTIKPDSCTNPLPCLCLILDNPRSLDLKLTRTLRPALKKKEILASLLINNRFEGYYRSPSGALKQSKQLVINTDDIGDVRLALFSYIDRLIKLLTDLTKIKIDDSVVVVAGDFEKPSDRPAIDQTSDPAILQGQRKDQAAPSDPPANDENETKKRPPSNSDPTPTIVADTSSEEEVVRQNGKMTGGKMQSAISIPTIVKNESMTDPNNNRILTKLDEFPNIVLIGAILLFLILAIGVPLLTLFLSIRNQNMLNQIRALFFGGEKNLSDEPGETKSIATLLDETISILRRFLGIYTQDSFNSYLHTFEDIINKTKDMTSQQQDYNQFLLKSKTQIDDIRHRISQLPDLTTVTLKNMEIQLTTFFGRYESIVQNKENELIKKYMIITQRLPNILREELDGAVERFGKKVDEAQDALSKREIVIARTLGEYLQKIQNQIEEIKTTSTELNAKLNLDVQSNELTAPLIDKFGLDIEHLHEHLTFVSDNLSGISAEVKRLASLEAALEQVQSVVDQIYDNHSEMPVGKALPDHSQEKNQAIVDTLNEALKKIADLTENEPIRMRPDNRSQKVNPPRNRQDKIGDSDNLVDLMNKYVSKADEVLKRVEGNLSRKIEFTENSEDDPEEPGPDGQSR